MIRSTIAACLVAGTVLPACACVFPRTYASFPAGVPDTFNWDAAPASEGVPAPAVVVEKIVRLSVPTTDLRMNACPSGELHLRVTVQARGTPALAELGFRFRTKPRHGPIAFAPGPVVGAIDGDSMRFTFYLFESSEQAGAGLSTDIEVHAVNRRNERGPATTVHLQAPRGKAPAE